MTQSSSKIPETPGSQGGVQVIARVAQVFRALDGEPQGLSLAQLAARLGLPRSTVHRIVTALVTEGFLASASPAGRVRIGAEFTRLATSSRLEPWEVAEPFMRRIFSELGETVDCAVVYGHQVRVVHVMPTRHELRAVAEVGATFPLHSSSKGKAMLAEFSPDTVVRMLPARLDRYTDKTPLSVETLLAELAGVRETGVAYDHEGTTVGICAAAIALREPSGTLLALSVPVPTQRYWDEKEKITRVLQQVRREARTAFGEPDKVAGEAGAMGARID
ncbi:IclR family transcriptional regulator [Streptomyces sp. NPDC059373]